MLSALKFTHKAVQDLPMGEAGGEVRMNSGSRRAVALSHSPSRCSCAVWDSKFAERTLDVRVAPAVLFSRAASSPIRVGGSSPKIANHKTSLETAHTVFSSITVRSPPFKRVISSRIRSTAEMSSAEDSGQPLLTEQQIISQYKQLLSDCQSMRRKI